jgi:hypothetical protein
LVHLTLEEMVKLHNTDSGDVGIVIPCARSSDLGGADGLRREDSLGADMGTGRKKRHFPQ